MISINTISIATSTVSLIFLPTYFDHRYLLVVGEGIYCFLIT